MVLMTFFEYHNAGNSEAQQLQAFAYMLNQASGGKANTGVLTGLSVAQTTTASESVVISAGAGVVQAATLDGASLVGDVQDTTLDILTGSPMGSVPRNDIVVADRATGSIRVIIGSPNVTPADPSVPSSAIKLARVRNAANATTVPSSAIDDLRVLTGIRGGEIIVANSAQRDALPKFVGLKVYRVSMLREERWDGTGWWCMAYGEETVTTNPTGDFTISTGLSSILTSTVENANGGVATGSRQNITVAKNAAYTGGNLTGRIYAADTKAALASTTAGIKWNAWGYA
jgi:hypothetical protein